MNELLARNLFHVLVVGPLFVYVAIARDGTPDAVYNILGALAAVIFLYHSYKAFTKLKAGQSAWVNWIHIFLIAPLLLILAYLKKSADARYYEMLLLLGFAAIGYHGFYAIRESMLV
jgi:hypothetical protein